MNKLNKNTKEIKLVYFHLDLCLQGVYKDPPSSEAFEKIKFRF